MRWAVVVAAVVAVGAGAGAGGYLALAGDDGYGRHGGTVGADGSARHALTVPAGSVAVVEVRPDADLDATVGFRLADGDGAERLEDVFEPVADELVSDDDLWFAFDVGFAGDVERTVIVAPVAVSGAVVVGATDGTAGRYVIELERFDLDADASSGLDDVLRAVSRADDVPDVLRDFYDLLLEQAEEGS